MKPIRQIQEAENELEYNDDPQRFKERVSQLVMHKPLEEVVKWFKVTLLVATMVAYDAFIAFMVWFTVGFFGAQDLFVPSIGMLVFWAVAISPIAVTGYCVIKLQAIRRGENPRI